MNKEQAAYEKKIKAEAQDALIKHIFDNLRNVMICVTLALAGGAVIKLRADSPFGSTINEIFGILIIFVAFGLCVWNMFHGVEKIMRPMQETKRKWLFLPFAVVYMFAVLIMFHDWAGFRAEQLSLNNAGHQTIGNADALSASPQHADRASNLNDK